MKGKIKSKYKRSWVYTLLGILFILSGFFISMQPQTAIAAMAICLGFAALLSGIFHISVFVETRKIYYGQYWELALGLLDIFFGLIILGNVSSTMAAIALFFGFWVLFAGINRIVVSFYFRDEGLKGWGLSLFFGILMIIAGTAAIFYPVINMIAIPVFMGVYLIVFGLALVFGLFTPRYTITIDKN